MLGWHSSDSRGGAHQGVEYRGKPAQIHATYGRCSRISRSYAGKLCVICDIHTYIHTSYTICINTHYTQVKKLLLFKLSKQTGVLVAMKNTIQGVQYIYMHTYIHTYIHIAYIHTYIHTLYILCIRRDRVVRGSRSVHLLLHLEKCKQLATRGSPLYLVTVHVCMYVRTNVYTHVWGGPFLIIYIL